MKTEEIKKHIEIEGVILTPELLQYLKSLQENDNDQIKIIRDSLADAICFIASCFHSFDLQSDRSKASSAMADLSWYRDDIDKLSKP